MSKEFDLVEAEANERGNERQVKQQDGGQLVLVDDHFSLV